MKKKQSNNLPEGQAAVKREQKNTKLVLGLCMAPVAILAVILVVWGIAPLGVEPSVSKIAILDEILNHELANETVFTLGPVFFDEGTVVGWLIIAAVLIVSLILTRNLKVENISKRQAAAEFIVTWLENFTTNMLGHKGAAYSHYLIAVLLYLGIGNVVGVLAMKPPASSLNTALAVALMSIILVQAAFIREKGVKKWAKSFLNPINLLDLVTRPLSLCMRLFGNVLAAFVIMEVLKTVVPVLLPAVFCLYFDFFDGILQAYVFVFLTALYIGEAVE